jgi:hypothetical protein
VIVRIRCQDCSTEPSAEQLQVLFSVSIIDVELAYTYLRFNSAPKVRRRLAAEDWMHRSGTDEGRRVSLKARLRVNHVSIFSIMCFWYIAEAGYNTPPSLGLASSSYLVHLRS